MIKTLIRFCCIGDSKSKNSCVCPSARTRKCHESVDTTGMCIREEADDRKKDKMLVIVISKMAKKGVYMSAVRMDEYCPARTDVLNEVGRQIAADQHAKIQDRDKEPRKTQKYKHKSPKEQGSTQKWKHKDKTSPPQPIPRRSPPPENKNPNIDSQPRVDSRTGLSFQEKQDMVSKVYEQPQFPQAYY